MFLPAGAPADISAKLGAEVARILKLADVQARIGDIGLQTVDTSPEQFANNLKNDFAVWGRVVREAQIKLEQ
jgi:tripartite-type tricarboxylate transporter receptor subunit TctC